MKFDRRTGLITCNRTGITYCQISFSSIPATLLSASSSSLPPSSFTLSFRPSLAVNVRCLSYVVRATDPPVPLSPFLRPSASLLLISSTFSSTVLSLFRRTTGLLGTSRHSAEAGKLPLCFLSAFQACYSFRFFVTNPPCIHLLRRLDNVWEPRGVWITTTSRFRCEEKL